MNENEFATGSVPVMVAARIYGKDASVNESKLRLSQQWLFLLF